MVEPQPVDTANFIRFPPFPAPPPGVKIIPFKDFKESGIKVFCENEEVEVDGRNVPTVELQHKHEVDLCKSNVKRKRQKISNVAPALPGQKKEWWQIWEDAEEERLYRYDGSLSRIDRLLAAATDFKSRPWPGTAAGLHSLWDQFRLFVGLLTNTHQRKTNGKAAPEESDSDSEMENETASGEAQKPPPPQVTNATDQITELDDVREDKLNAFLNDPEQTIKIFLSSHMRKQGLIWADRNLKLVPHLVKFFLRFLLRNKVFSDSTSERGLRSALEIAKLAMIEMPLTSQMAKAMPDSFSEGCKECWGSRVNGYKPSVVNLPVTRDGNDEGERDAKRQRLETTDAGWGQDFNQDAKSKADVEAFEAELRAANVQVISGEDKINLVKEVISDNMNADDSGWGVSADSTAWGNGWAMGMNDSGSTGDAWLSAWETDVKSLMPLLGPTALPLTHTIGIIESSMRRILSVTMPSDGITEAPSGPVEGPYAVESELKERFARVVMAPWMGWEGEDEEGHSEPTIMAGSQGPVVGYEDRETDAPAGRKPHDPRKDEITVLLDPAAVSTLSVGMGIGAVWVQIVRQETASVPAAAGKSKKSKSKAKKKIQETFWYMEELSMTFPSYYTPASRG